MDQLNGVGVRNSNDRKSQTRGTMTYRVLMDAHHGLASEELPTSALNGRMTKVNSTMLVFTVVSIAMITEVANFSTHQHTHTQQTQHLVRS